MEGNDDIPQLSAETYAVLQEFYREQKEKQDRLCNASKDSALECEIEEDWQLSQFWYDDKTVETLGGALLKVVNNNGRIALVSCPTLYTKIKEAQGDHTVSLFEFDPRFSKYGADFIQYDYKDPLNVPYELVNSFDLVVADPPFLSEECLSKTAQTIKHLAKDKIVVCTGAIMEELAEQLLDVKKCSFKPGHKNNLANEFSCFSNFNLDSFIDESG